MRRARVIGFVKTNEDQKHKVWLSKAIHQCSEEREDGLVDGRGKVKQVVQD